MSEITITVSGRVGCGKSAMLGEIEILCKALGLPVRFEDEAAWQAEKNGTHADWTAALEMYQPSIVLVEAGPASVAQVRELSAPLVLEQAAQACDQQADGTNGPYRTACLQCANAVRELRDAAAAKGGA